MIRVAVECRIPNAQQGVGTAVIAVAKALSESERIDQSYTFIVHEEMRSWLAPYVRGRAELACVPASNRMRVKRALRSVPGLRSVKQGLDRLRLKTSATAPQPPESDGFLEAGRFDLVHFPTQTAYLTKVPSIYQPWDLQHIHYPEFFTAVEYANRERFYRTFCNQATFVCVQAEWTKKDLLASYSIPEHKIVVIPWGSVFQAYASPSQTVIEDVIARLRLPRTFFFYPAVTWPHKNHEVILRALHLLKMEDGTTPHVYCTGASTVYRGTIEKIARELGVADQLHFLGFLSPEEVQVVFGTATAMIFASKFEGFGLPILEAFQAKLPVISSNATTLPEVARDAALYFDPDSPTALVAAMRTVLGSSDVREAMKLRGSEVLLQYSMQATAAQFQALYERTAASSRAQAGTRPAQG